MNSASSKVTLPLPAVLIPQVPNQQSAPIYYDSTQTPQAIMGSVDAGALDLWVGGGGSNGDFKAVFSQHSKQTSVEIDQYQTIHENSIKNSQPGQFNVDAAPQGGFLKVSLAWHPPAPKVPSSKNVGVVYVDVFEDGFRPFGFEPNYAMVYVVGPDGSGGASGAFKNQTDFLDAVERTAGYMIAAVKQYNTQVVPNHPQLKLKQLETLRVAAYSVGYFNFFGKFVKVPEIATRILQGMSAELDQGTGGLKTLEFENGYGQFAGLV